MSDFQLSMDFPAAHSLGRDDFILGACNAFAADWIDRWPDWPGRIKGVVIQGPEASGKSHLAAIWQSLSGASLLTRLDDDSMRDLENTPHQIWDRPEPGTDWPDDLMLHHLNMLTDIGGSVLILSREPMSALNWTLKDNNSRLRGLVSAAITTPDDDVLVSLFHKHADDFGLPLDGDVARYMVSRVDRRFDAVADVMKMLNNACLSGQRKLTIPVVRTVLDELQGNRE
jgi:chromosomal replication initiation ATPase DnaA